jgi:hypothetical protein
MLVVYDLLVRVSDDIVEKGSVVSGGGVQSCLEQILHIVLSKGCHASDTFPTSICQTGLYAAFAERCGLRRDIRQWLLDFLDHGHSLWKQVRRILVLRCISQAGHRRRP